MPLPRTESFSKQAKHCNTYIDSLAYPRLPSPTLAYPCITNPLPTFQMLDPWILRRTAFKHCLEQRTRYFRQESKAQIFP
jgi:hypothetical protein